MGGGSLDWEYKDTLGSLVSTCTSISEPALDALWKYLDDTGSLCWLLEMTKQNVCFYVPFSRDDLMFLKRVRTFTHT